MKYLCIARIDFSSPNIVDNALRKGASGSNIQHFSMISGSITLAISSSLTRNSFFTSFEDTIIDIPPTSLPVGQQEYPHLLS